MHRVVDLSVWCTKKLEKKRKKNDVFAQLHVSKGPELQWGRLVDGGWAGAQSGAAAAEGYSGLGRRLRTRSAMSPCHRHGNAAAAADSLGLIGSCQGNDKMNAAV